MDTYLTFSLGKDHFALDVNHVEKILENQPVTEVPKAPDYMLGVFNLRGEVIPLVNTRMKFGLESLKNNNSSCVLVINIDNEGEKIKLGVLVDSVNEVVKYEADQILPLPTVGKQTKTEFIQGILKMDEQFILLLNVDKIFSVDEIVDLKIEGINA